MRVLRWKAEQSCLYSSEKEHKNHQRLKPDASLSDKKKQQSNHRPRSGLNETLGNEKQDKVASECLPAKSEPPFPNKVLIFLTLQRETRTTWASLGQQAAQAQQLETRQRFKNKRTKKKKKIFLIHQEEDRLQLHSVQLETPCPSNWRRWRQHSR